MSYRKLLVPLSCGVALQGLFHCVLYFEVITETPFDFTPQRCKHHCCAYCVSRRQLSRYCWRTSWRENGTPIQVSYWGAYGFVDVTMSIIWKFCLFVAKVPLKPYFVLPVKVFSSPFVESASLPCHPTILICFMHVLRTFFVGHGFWRLVFI